MATLDEKFLDGPNVGYCSDSDEEEQSNAGCSANNRPPAGVTSGRAGAKGVLDDYRAAKEASRQAAILAEQSLIEQAQRFNLTTSEHRNEQLSDEEDELEAIRRRRLEHLQNRQRACIVEISDKDSFLQAIEATQDGSVAFFHIYRDDLEATETLNEALIDLAVQSKKCSFFKVQSKVLDMSGRFRKTALPTLQVYRNEDLIGNFVRITDTLGEDFDSRDLKRLLAENDIVLETRD